MFICCLSAAWNLANDGSGAIAQTTEVALVAATRLALDSKCFSLNSALSHFVEHDAVLEQMLISFVPLLTLSTWQKTVHFKGDTQGHRFIAYQRRKVKGGGLLVKQLLCYRELNDANLDSPEKCCVNKASEQLVSIWPSQALETKLM